LTLREEIGGRLHRIHIQFARNRGFVLEAASLPSGVTRTTMDESKIAVFFYGSYMNRRVLAELELAPECWEPASVAGFDIRIAPRANLIAAPGHTVYGVLATATHAELERLYAHAHDVLGETYLPHPVIVRTDSGEPRPALCYIAPQMVERPAERDYVDRILEPARALGFPSEYLARLESFRS
jgi:Gamma-glutamyl cyclotransferase, AIG2-like